MPNSTSLPTTESSRWTFWQWLVEPAASIQKPEARRQARLLAALLLVLIPSITMGAIMSWRFIRTPAVSGTLAISAVALMLAYILSRMPSYRLGAVLAISFISIIPFAPFLLNPDNSPERVFRSLVWIVMTVLLGNLILSMRGLAIVIIANWLALAFLPATQTSIEPSSFILVVSFVTVISILIWVAARHRNLIERDRLAELSATNCELAALRTSLEQQVEARTAELARRTLELEETQNFLTLIIDTLPSALFVKDARTFNYIHWNKAAEELFGLDREEMLGKGDEELFPKELASRFNKEDRMLVNERKLLDIGEERVETQTQGQRILHTRKVLVTNADNSPKYILGISEDITERQQIEAAREQSEALFRGLFDYSPDAVILIDPHGPGVSWPIIDCNPAACEMNGYNREELIGQSVDILNTTTGTETERAAYYERLQAAGNLKLETFHCHKNGTIFPIEVSTSLINVRGRELVIGIDRDITERKRAEEALHRQNSYLEALHDTTLGLLSRTELKSLLEEILSRAAQLVSTPHGYIYLLGRETSEPAMEVKVGIGGCTRYVGLNIRPGEGISGLAWQTGQPQIINDYDQWAGRLEALERADFRSVMAVPLISVAQGVIGVMGLAYDAESSQVFGEDEVGMLTRFAQLTSVALDNARMYMSVQEYAAENEALYRAAATLLNPGADLTGFAEQIAQAVTREFALSNCGVLLIDETGTYLKRIATAGEFQVANLPVLPLTGSGLTVSAVHSGEMVYVPDVTADPRYLAGDPRTRSELVIPLKSQNRVTGVLDLQSSELKAFDERSRRIIAAFAKHAALALENVRLVKNLAEAYRRLQEDQKQLLAAEKMASLGRLTAGIAHEMNTPLAAMRAGLSEINNLIVEYQNAIGDSDITLDDHRGIISDMQKAAQLTISSAERAAAFVRSIKSQTRDLSSNERIRFKIVPVIKDTLLLLGHALRYGKCTATFEYDADDLDLIGSPGRLSQVITNLMTNAMDASADRGGGSIQVQLTQAPHGLDLRVSDSGVGIPPEILPKIFEPMFTTKPFGQGTGLGLTIIHDIVTGDFGGTVEVASQPGQGTTFTIHFPIHKEF